MQITEWLGKENKLGIDIWNHKYKFENESFDEWLDRVSNGNKELRQLIIDKKFLFGGRILASRGLQNKGRKITFSNCYVLSPPEDNIESIFECAKKLARTYSYGGGVGIDISKLSPRNAKINNAAKETSGSVSFMDLYSLVTELIGQSGRRGALMISIDCNHPDLEEFINLKSDLNKVTKANISIRINKQFMDAVKNNDDWKLTYIRDETGEKIEKVIKAKELFNKLAKMNWDYAEPGLLYWDKIREWNLLSEDNNFEFAGVNPCAEEPLPAGGSCLLGSINLSEFVVNPFSDQAYFDTDNFNKVVKQSVIALNEVLDEGLSLHPLQEQRESVRNWRQMGLGIMGQADCLIKLGIRYGSKESLLLLNKIGNEMINSAIQQSALLAKDYGVYPKYNKKAIISSPFFQNNANGITKTMVEKYGLRNSQLLTIAPTGSLSSMLGISGGIEPIYNISYTRKTESLHKKEEYYKVYTPIAAEYMMVKGIEKEEDLPDIFVTAMTLNHKERIDIQSTWQTYIDASISSTVNVPQDFTVEQVEDLYLYGYEKGLKGVTIFRDNCARIGILTNNTNGENTEEIEEKYIIPKGAMTRAKGERVKLPTGCGSVWLMTFKDKNGNLAEIFSQPGTAGGCNGLTEALTRTVSLLFRSGVEPSYIIDQLQSVKCPVAMNARREGKCDGKSCSDIIAKELLHQMGKTKNKLTKEKNNNKIQRQMVNLNYEDTTNCPECGEELRFEGGCSTCPNCGHSKCS